METWQKILLQVQKGARHENAPQSAGFALITLISMIPLVMTVIFGVSLTYYVLKRKSLAQSICVNQASQLQYELKSSLEKLLRMNTRAKILRARRLIADVRLANAITSAYPPAIALAKALREEVIMEQHEFHAEQLVLLAQAQITRSRYQVDLHPRVAHFPAWAVHTPTPYIRALAVDPVPENSDSPDYVPVQNFELFQQQAFSYTLNILAGFPFLTELNSLRKLSSIQEFTARTNQTTQCSVTLTQRSSEWSIQILAARAP